MSCDLNITRQCGYVAAFMGGALSKLGGCFYAHFKAKRGVFAVSFTDLPKFTLLLRRYYKDITKIDITLFYKDITISMLDIGFKWCFTIIFFCFERVLLSMRGYTC